MDYLGVVAIGCAPSSGSTLLADLLDSVPGVSCGPELNILCIPAAYPFDADFRRRAVGRESFAVGTAATRHSRFFNTRHLAETGLSIRTLDRMIEEAEKIQLQEEFSICKYKYRWCSNYSPRKTNYLEQAALGRSRI